MSGDYNLQSYTQGYFDQDVYFNNPMAYLPNLNDDHTLSLLRNRKIYILFQDQEVMKCLRQVGVYQMYLIQKELTTN